MCTCCHRIMYRESVILCNKYTKASPDLLNTVFSANKSCISGDGKEYMCKTSTNKRFQAIASKGILVTIFVRYLLSLNLLELRLISLRVPFMKMVTLPFRKQRSIHGPTVNVPSKVDTICEILPCLPSQSELVPLKLKRKVPCLPSQSELVPLELKRKL